MPQSFRLACVAPMLTGAGKRVCSRKDKCDILANFFENRLKDQLLQSAGVRGPMTREGRRGPPPDDFSLFQPFEIRKSLLRLVTKKAAAPDGLSAELFRFLPSPNAPLCVFFIEIIVRGNFSRKLRELHVARLDKPHEDSHLCTSKRPISLTCGTKVLELAANHRLLPSFEPWLCERQYACCRAPGSILRGGGVGIGKYMFMRRPLAWRLLRKRPHMSVLFPHCRVGRYMSSYAAGRENVFTAPADLGWRFL